MSEPLVLVTKLGLNHAEPPGLYDALADQLDANHLDPKDVREDLFGFDRVRNSRSAKRVDNEMVRLATLSLLQGVPVIYDALMNNPHKREKLIEITKAVGAHAVMLHPKTSFKTIKARIIASVEAKDISDEEKEQKTKEKMGHAKNLRDYLDRPDINPDANGIPHFCFDGEQSVADVLPSITQYIESLREPA